MDNISSDGAHEERRFFGSFALFDFIDGKLQKVLDTSRSRVRFIVAQVPFFLSCRLVLFD
jgi:hypothetical protein